MDIPILQYHIAMQFGFYQPTQTIPKPIFTMQVHLQEVLCKNYSIANIIAASKSPASVKNLV
jgi:hypothetical protein